MNLQNLTTEELFVITGGEDITLVTGGNGNIYDDGSGQGCIIVYNPFIKK